MRVLIDGVVEFEEVSVSVGSWQRKSIERGAAGLDGVVSVDLGKRGREIVQRGVVRAGSDDGLCGAIAAVEGLVDGSSHVMSRGGCGDFGGLRVDGVEVKSRSRSGVGASCEFEVRYFQLGSG
jgi:hypothetical protein